MAADSAVEPGSGLALGRPESEFKNCEANGLDNSSLLGESRARRFPIGVSRVVWAAGVNALKTTSDESSTTSVAEAVAERGTSCSGETFNSRAINGDLTDLGDATTAGEQELDILQLSCTLRRLFRPKLLGVLGL